MDKKIIVTLVGVLACGSLAAPVAARKPAKPKNRVIELAYTEPALGAAGVGVCLQGTSCLFYGPPAAGETSFSVEIEDDLGQPVPATVIQDTNGDGSFLATDDLSVGICGETEEPVEIEAGKAVSVWVWRAGVTPPCPGSATSGVDTATFSK